MRGKPLFPAVGIVLHGQYLPTEVCAGQQWAMTLKVRAVHGQLNEGAFDSQRYALAQHQPLTGRFLQAKAINPGGVACVRAILASLRATLAPYPWQQVILALGMGERGAVSQEVKAVMRDTGTAHLMAISGLHIAFAALLAAGLIRGGQFFLPVRWIRWQTPLLGGILCAICYAWLTGLQPPALRTVAALSVWGRIKIKRTTVERLASLVLLSGRDYFRRSCGGYITKSLAVSICGCRPVILVSVVSCAKRKFSTGLTLVA
ncbi:ComEC family competence protein [Salmonella enterica subsp. enterica]|uniref:ComEC family competence protein n=1 Tax=Salmonella enterica I TaxID=59201 RepID=A0A379WW58_SALET|nr:ComEC family competence protein [Salmonella enterica subsp. enterica]